MSVVVDTSVWIDWFKGRQVDAVDQALDRGLVVLPPLVIAELVAGARRTGEREQLEAALADLPMCECPRPHWARVGALRARALSHGLTVSTPDAHIAQCALDLDATLLTRDEVFSRLATLCPLRL